MSEELERSEIELLDLGDATVETKQWSVWPIWYDSVFLLGEKEP
jgi:hypothetical protein